MQVAAGICSAERPRRALLAQIFDSVLFMYARVTAVGDQGIRTLSLEATSIGGVLLSIWIRERVFGRVHLSG